jgi:chaperonin cofactor prefoldin
MSTPVTRGELRKEIERLEIRLDQKLDRLDQKFDQKFTQMASTMATKTDLEIWGGALFERLLTELARHTKAVQEALSTQVSAIDDKYADLPARMNRLEAAVFTTKRH